MSVRVRSLGWVCCMQEQLCEGAVRLRHAGATVRVRCDRDSRAQVYLLFILKTLGKLGKNVWLRMVMQALDPNKIQVRTWEYYLC